MSFTCTSPAVNMPEVTNARPIVDQGTKANKSADFADIVLLHSQCSEISNLQSYSVYSKFVECS